jgi:hypothetical protein
MTTNVYGNFIPLLKFKRFFLGAMFLLSFPLFVFEVFSTNGLTYSLLFYALLWSGLFSILSLSISSYLLIFYFVFFFRYVLFPVFFKGLHLESVLDGMRSDGSVVLLIFAFMFPMGAMFKFLDSVDWNGGVLKIQESDKLLRAAPVVFLVFGVLINLVNIAVRPVILEGNVVAGFGGFGAFASIWIVGLILHLKSQAKSGSFLKIDRIVISYFLFSLLITFLANAKQTLFLTFIALFFSAFFYGLKFRIHHVVYSAIGVIFIVLFISPIIQGTRTVEFRTAGMVEKFDIIMSSHDDIFSDDYREYYSISFDYLGTRSALVDRLDMISESDVVVAGVDSFGPVGSYPIVDGFIRALPSFLIKNKSEAAVTDKIMWDIRELPYGIISRLTIGLPASIYAVTADFYAGFYSLLTLGIFLSVLCFLFGNKGENFLGVYFLSLFSLQLTEKTFEEFVMILIRDIPLNLVVIFALVVFCRIFKLNFEEGGKI